MNAMTYGLQIQESGEVFINKVFQITFLDELPYRRLNHFHYLLLVCNYHSPLLYRLDDHGIPFTRFKFL